MKPTETGTKAGAKPERIAREAAALRANLLKRKQQVRQRAQDQAKERS